MKSLKVGYWPLSPNLMSAGDRRRVVFWTQSRGHQLITDLSQKVDVMFASEKSNFNSQVFAKLNVPLVFDLVDAYLSPLNAFDDLARGIAKNISGDISGGIRPFSQHVRDFCLRADAVICSSIEQETEIRPYCSNTHVILDSHDEIPFNAVKFSNFQGNNRKQVLWEGQPATIRGVRSISSTLSQLAKSNNLYFDFVTDESYFQFLGKYVNRSTLSLLRNNLGEIHSNLRLTPWTLSNLLKSAKRSSMAIIPVDLSVPMQRLKPENRLLIMWRLGLPCLTSATPAYVRVSNKAGVKAACKDSDAWLSNSDRLINDLEFAYEETARGQSYLRSFHTRNILLDKWDRAVESVLN
jgi:hypothetical protein